MSLAYALASCVNLDQSELDKLRYLLIFGKTNNLIDSAFDEIDRLIDIVGDNNNGQARISLRRVNDSMRIFAHTIEPQIDDDTNTELSIVEG